MIRSIGVPTGLVLLFLLTGCGGGGGGGGESARSLMTITSENSSTVATAAWGALASGDILLDGDPLPLQVTGAESEDSATVRNLSILRGATVTARGYLERSETLVPLADPGDLVLSPQATETSGARSAAVSSSLRQAPLRVTRSSATVPSLRMVCTSG